MGGRRGGSREVAAACAIVPLPVTAIAIVASMAGIMVGAKILDRISEAHFRASRRRIVTLVCVGFLVQAIRLA